MSYLESLIEKLSEKPHFNTFYPQKQDHAILYRFPNGEEIMGDMIPSLKTDIYIKTGIDENGKEYLKRFYVRFTKRYESMDIFNNGIYVDWRRTKVLDDPNEYLKELKEMVNILKLMNLNVVVLNKYLKDTYKEEKYYPVLVKEPIRYSWHESEKIKYKKKFTPPLTRLDDETYKMHPAAFANISLPFGEEMEHFITGYLYMPILKREDEKYVEIYCNGTVTFYRKISSEKEERKSDFRKILIMMEHVKKHNEKIRTHKNREEAYLSYLNDTSPELNL